MKNCKLYIGCVSKNTIDAVIELANRSSYILGLIPSRRQVDHDGGYVGFTTKSLKEYLTRQNPSRNVLLERDHGGPNQGKTSDDGVYSLKYDSNYCDIIHIDPWKKYLNFSEGLESTKHLITEVVSGGYQGSFEISTEGAIKEFTKEEFSLLIEECIGYNISHVVIDTGTRLTKTENCGIYDKEKVNWQIEIIKNINEKYGKSLLVKEHNGDYITTPEINNKFNDGINAINIAPEFGCIESQCYISMIESYNPLLLDIFFDICYESNAWKKWILPYTDYKSANLTKKDIIKICGHYVLNTHDFKHNIEDELPIIRGAIINKIQQKIEKIYDA